MGPSWVLITMTPRERFSISINSIGSALYRNTHPPLVLSNMSPKRGCSRRGANRTAVGSEAKGVETK